MDPNLSLDINQEEMVNQNNRGYDTLDEPKRKSLQRDVNSIIAKAKIALFPMKAKDSKLLQDWDFWGPLILCLTLGLVLSWQKHNDNSGIVFIMIFTIVWIGGLIVSLNSQFLGVNLSIFQCICILGYCMLAIVLASIFNLLFSFLPYFMHLIITLLAGFYSIFGKLYIYFTLHYILNLGAYKFVGQYAPQNKKLLVSYPISLFYLFLAWFTFS
jgi:hypothetical protein